MTIAGVMSIGVGLCSSGQWGCSLAVNLDGLSANQQDGGDPEPGRTADAGLGPDAPSSPPPVDANEHDAANAAKDGQMPGGKEDALSGPVDASASETMAVGSDAGAPTGEMDAATSDTPHGEHDAETPDALSGPLDADAPDTSTGDLAAGGDGPGVSGDAPSDVSGGSDAGARPLACPASPLVATTLQLANAPSAQTACSYVPSELPRYYAAVDSTVFNGSAACGACMIIQTPAGMVEARVVDMGPSPSRANPTAVAVNRAAITVLAPDGSTSVTQGVDWHFTPCTLSAPGMTFKIQTGSNADYAGVLIENHRYRLAKVEYKIRGTYRALTRSTYNYWIASDGMGTGPFILRMTDELGQTVEQTGIPLEPGKVFKGQAQFPTCSP